MIHSSSNHHRRARRELVIAVVSSAVLLSLPTAILVEECRVKYSDKCSVVGLPRTKPVWVVTDSRGNVYYAKSKHEYVFTDRLWMMLESGEERTITAPYTIELQYVER